MQKGEWMLDNEIHSGDEQPDKRKKRPMKGVYSITGVSGMKYGFL